MKQCVAKRARHEAVCSKICKTCSSVESKGQDMRLCGFKAARQEAVLDSKSQHMTQCGAKVARQKAVWSQNGITFSRVDSKGHNMK